MLRINKIAFDFDGVIADTSKEKIKWLKRRGINIDKTDKTNFYEILSKRLKKEEIDALYKNMSKDIFTPQILENTLPIKNSINVIKKLSKKFSIYIITARTGEMISLVNNWLKKYDIDKNIKEVISSSDRKKQDICLKNNIYLLCDDDLRHIIDNKVNVRILFNKKTLIKDGNIIIDKSNYDHLREIIDFDNCLIMESWDEIEKFLLINPIMTIGMKS